jgi:hypothetical protein
VSIFKKPSAFFAEGFFIPAGKGQPEEDIFTRDLLRGGAGEGKISFPKRGRVRRIACGEKTAVFSDQSSLNSSSP